MSFKNERLDWNDLSLFLAITRAGSLAGAVQSSNTSAPTLSRRLAALEARLGIQLFIRQHSGLVPTAEGRELVAQVENMDVLAQSIQTWLKNKDQRPMVRITAGSWTSVFLARKFAQLSNLDNTPKIELLSGSNFLNLLKREADIAIRNKIPDQQGLRRQRIGSVGFAIFGSPEYLNSTTTPIPEHTYRSHRWVLPSTSGSTGRSSFWLRDRIGSNTTLMCDTPQAVLEAACAGAGLCLLPCFIGSNEPRLVQCSDPIEELSHVQWIVTSDNLAAYPHVRKTASRLSALFKQNQDQFTGTKLHILGTAI